MVALRTPGKPYPGLLITFDGPAEWRMKDVGPVERITSPDLDGVRIGDRVVLFHTERGFARSALFFDVGGEGVLKFLVASLAPGTWEIWWRGYLVDHQGGVERETGALYFEGRPGGYFLRRLN